MNLKNKKVIQKSFSEIFQPGNYDEALGMETRLLMYRFLSEIEKITEERGINRKELARLIGTSPSYITQLYRGTKTVNLQTLAKFQVALNFTFKIKASQSGNDVSERKPEENKTSRKTSVSFPDRSGAIQAQLIDLSFEKSGLNPVIHFSQKKKRIQKTKA